MSLGPMYKIISTNQCRYYPSEKVPQRSPGHADIDTSHESREKWALANILTGRRTKNLLNTAFLGGLVQAWFHNFQDIENNNFLRWVDKLLYTVPSVLEGERDNQMYANVYGMGIGRNLTEEEIRNPELALKLGKVPFVDDWLENKRQEKLYGERIIPKLGALAYYSARVKPLAHLLSGLVLGGNFRGIVETVMDIPARWYWRGRFFGGALHANFLTTIWDLSRLRFMSFFGSQSAKLQYQELVTKIGRDSQTYFKNKYGESNVSNTPSSLGTYFAMLKDRMKEHSDSISVQGARKSIQRKIDEGFFAKIDSNQRLRNPDRTIDRGFADPNDMQSDVPFQRRTSLVDFTGPISASLGLFATTIFDPLKCLWRGLGIEKGKYLIEALSASRKSFQLLNYVPRFIETELNSGKGYEMLEPRIQNVLLKMITKGVEAKQAELILRQALKSSDFKNTLLLNPEVRQKLTGEEIDECFKDENVSEIMRQFYLTKKNRYYNGMLGLVVAASSIFEPIAHLFRPAFQGNRFYSFLFDSLIKFNDDFFLRFFSLRRETLGMEAYLRSFVERKLGSKKHVEIKDLATRREKLPELQFHASQVMNGQNFLSGNEIFSRISRFADKIVSNIEGGVGFIDELLTKSSSIVT